MHGTAGSQAASTGWWRGRTGYEVYLRSFADSDDDGTGDLPGLIGRLDHLVDLGVEILWVTPFYPSPMADFGYDVADYCDVDPRFGTLDDVDRLVLEAHRRDIRVVIDIVPNHTSDRHAWFEAAQSAPDDPHRGYYHWRDPAPDGGPPNNWVSYFGGPAWTLDQASGQYYLHLFLPEQPDLDWSNPDVRKEFDRILRFWLDRGVDGFRVDVAHALVKDGELRDNPGFVEPGAGPTAEEIFDSFDHRHDIDQPGVVEIYRRWRAIAAEYDALLLGEVYLQDPAALSRYVDDALDLSFCFALLNAPWDAGALGRVIESCVDSLGDAAAWPISSHDDPRAPTRFGGGPSGWHRALSLTTALAFVPGVLFLYQGDELGLADATVALADAVDPVAVRNQDPAQGRDGVRTPFPWDDRPGLGFTDGTPWLPDGGRVAADTVAHQRGREGAPLERHRALLALRRQWRELDTAMVWDDVGFSYRRGPLHVTVNCGPEPLRLERDGRLLFGSDPSVVLDGTRLTIPPDHAAVVELR